MRKNGIFGCDFLYIHFTLPRKFISGRPCVEFKFTEVEFTFSGDQQYISNDEREITSPFRICFHIFDLELERTSEWRDANSAAVRLR
jgi:hypothetical protein